MSSQYKQICLTHDPGIEVGDEADWRKPEMAIGAVVMRSGPAEEHKSCDLVVGRYSYPMIEVCCVPPAIGEPQPHGWHRDPKWIDTGWLRLLHRARENDDGADRAVRSAAQCWPEQRLNRLEPHFRWEEV